MVTFRSTFIEVHLVATIQNRVQSYEHQFKKLKFDLNKIQDVLKLQYNDLEKNTLTEKAK